MPTSAGDDARPNFLSPGREMDDYIDLGRIALSGLAAPLVGRTLLEIPPTSTTRVGGEEVQRTGSSCPSHPALGGVGREAPPAGGLPVTYSRERAGR